MSKVKFRPFWSYDVLKTEKWLTKMSEKGYELKKVNFKLRLFKFKRENKTKNVYHIIYNKHSNGFPEQFISSGEFEGVTFNKNYYILKEKIDNPSLEPSYNQLLEKNRKIKYWVGSLLLVELMLYLFPVLIMLIAALSGRFHIEYSASYEQPANLRELIEGIIILILFYGYWLVNILMIFIYFKLGRSNKRLEKVCGDSIDLSFTIPKETKLSKREMKQLKKSNQLIKKMRIAWFYAPDKTEKWLEEMEAKGFNLIKMSKLGNSFYFITGKPRKVKYHADFQLSKKTGYFNMNKESGWELFFTSVTRFFSLTVWGQEYTDEPPLFYSDSESKLKHARTYAIYYSVVYIPAVLIWLSCLVYLVSIISKINISFFFVLAVIPMLFVPIEYSYFVFKVWRYYSRVKNEKLISS